MLITLIIVLTILFLVALVVLALLYKNLTNKNIPKENNQNLFLLLQQQIQELNKTIDQKMTNTTKVMNDTQQHINRTLQDQFGQNTKIIQNITAQSNKMIADITEKVTTLEKTNQQVIGFSEQLSNLEKVLTNQKKRGNLGEAGLKLVLENILPPTIFKLQYKFDDGDIVDAVIFTKDGIIPIDAKFSLDNYQRVINAIDDVQKEKSEKDFKNDLKKRIDETSKYIKPKENTLDFAFMFIPSEAIYYDLLVNEVGSVKVNTQNLIEYAFREKKVIIVSPTTFTAYLHTVLQGLRSLQIEEGAKEIRKNVEKLENHIAAYENYMKKLGYSMITLVNNYNIAYKELGKIDKDIIKIIGGEHTIEPLQLDKPFLDINK